MAQSFKPYPVKVSQGGSLITVPSIENVSEENWREKTNFRRITVDKETLREGDQLFTPIDGNEAARIAQVLKLNAGITVIGMVTRPNGDKSIVAGSASTIYKFNFGTGLWVQAGTGYSTSAAAKRWQLEENNGWLCFNNGVDLPFTLRQEDVSTVPMYKLRQIGIAAVGRIGVSNGMLVLGDLTEIQASQKAGILNGGDPWGIVDPTKVNRIQYKLLWSEIGGPRDYAVIFPATMAAAGHVAVLAFKCGTSLNVGDLIGISGAGPGGGMLGGQSGVDDGIAITAIAGDQITVTWDVAHGSDASLAYPLAVEIALFADFSSIVGTFTLQDDSSRILTFKQLGRNRIAVYRETGIFTGRFTGDLVTPWVWDKTRYTRNVPAFEDAVVNPNGEMHIYPSFGSFYKFDGSSDPEIIKELELSKNLFFDGLDYTTNATDVFAVINDLTKEIWFCRPDLTYVYDYRFNKAASIDREYTAGALVTKPGTTMTVMLVGRDDQVCQYGLDQAGTRIFYLENLNGGGTAIIKTGYTCRLLSGLCHMGDEFNQKHLRSYVPSFLSSGDPQVDIKVSLLATESPSKDIVRLFRRTIRDIRKNLIPTLYEHTYFQEEIVVVTTDNIYFPAVDFTGRIWEVARVQTRGITKTSL